MSGGGRFSPRADHLLKLPTPSLGTALLCVIIVMVIMSEFETAISEALEDPQPGDWWNEMLINRHLVVAIQGQYVFVLKETEPAGENSYRYTGKIEMWDRDRFRNECRFAYPYRKSRMEIVNAARKELGLVGIVKQDV